MYEKKGEFKKARKCYAEAIEEIEKGRDIVNSPLLSMYFFEAYGEPYDRLVSLLYDEHDYAGALSYKEKGKARTVLDYLAKNRLSSRTSKEWVEKKQALQAKVSSLQRALWELGSEKSNKASLAKNPSRPSNLENKLEQAQKELFDLIALAQTQHRGILAPKRNEKTLIQDLQTRLLDRTRALLVYHVADDFTLAWIITTDHCECVKLPVKKTDLLQKIDLLRQPIDDLKKGKKLLKKLTFDLPTSYALYKALFEPLKSNLRGRTQLVIVPDDVLCYLPFEALVTELVHSTGDSPKGAFYQYRGLPYLLRQYTISYCSSANILRYLLKTRPSKISRKSSLLAVGDPVWNTLPNTGQEIKDITAYFEKSEIYTREAATEKKVKELAPQCEILHFATHATSNDKQPLLSFVQLEASPDALEPEDGLFQAIEISELKLKALLVVLGGCETGLGRLSRGEGLIGLVNAFFQAGAKSVLSSLWVINDETSALLMKYFYENLSSGMDKASSLRMAKVKLIDECKDEAHNKYYANPLLWAPFVLVGDYR